MYDDNKEVVGGGRPGADWGDGTSSAVQPPNPDTADTPPPPPPPTHVMQHLPSLARRGFGLENKILIHQTFNIWLCHMYMVMVCIDKVHISLYFFDFALSEIKH